MKIKIRINYILYLLLALLPILPEYFRIGGYAVYLFLVLLLLVSMIFSVKMDKKKIKMIMPFILLLGCVDFIANIRFGEITAFIAYIIIPCLLIFSIYILVVNDDMINIAYDILVIVGNVICVFGIIERFSGYNIFSIIENTDMGFMGSAAYFRDGIIRIEQSFGTCITYALYLTFINALAFGKYIEAKRNKIKKHRSLYLLTYLLTIINIFFSNSRMAIIVLVLMQIAFFLKAKMSKKFFVVFIVLELITIDSFTTQTILGYIQKYFTLVADVVSFRSNNSIADMTSAYRLELLTTLIPYLDGHWIFGYGSEFMAGFHFSMLGGYTYSSIDNAILSVLMRHGIFGLFILLFPIICGMKLSYNSLKRKDQMGYYLFVAFIGYFVNLLSVAQMAEQRIVYVFIGLLFAKEWISRKELDNGCTRATY